jgi:acyl-coenzyme A synthetase/AMP-(fatty) acid ligase
VVLKPGKQVAGEALRGYLRERLPEYMVPQMVTIMPSLPVNANGKIDRQALPDVESAAGQQERVRPGIPSNLVY